MTSRPLEHLVLFTAVATGSQDEGEENLIVLLAWEIISISKNQVLVKDQVYVCPGGGTPRNLPPGVNLEMVQAAGNIDSALKQFHATLTKLGGSTFSLMTFGPFPLRGLLHPQCYKICLGLQKYLHRYMDIAKEFTRAFPTVSAPTSVKEMGSIIGIHTEAETLTGPEELSIIGEVAKKLVAQGHIFQSQEIIRDDNKLDVTPDPSLVKEGCVVRLRGLPYQAELKEVAGFLSGLNCIPGGIVFGLNSVGRRTGEALVVLENQEQAVLALQRHRQYMNQRYVELYEATPDDFSRLTGIRDGAGGSGGSSEVWVARLQGLPYRVSEQEIVDFFQPSAAVKHGKDGVMIVHYADGKATGDGFALFQGERDLTAALQLNKSMMGSRYVELFKSSVKEFEMVLGRSGTEMEQQHFGKLLGLTITGDPELEKLRGSDKNCVKLRGIPFHATPEDVILFFGELKEDIAIQGVHMVLNAVNRPTGECYVQMKTVESAAEVKDTLHNKYMENRYIEVFQCSGDEVSRGIQDGGGSGGGGRGFVGSAPRRGGRRYDDGDRRRRESGERGNKVKVRGLPYESLERDVSSFFQEYDVRDGDVEVIKNNSGRSTGIAFVTFRSKELASQAVREKNNKHIGSRYVELSIPY